MAKKQRTLFDVARVRPSRRTPDVAVGKSKDDAGPNILTVSALVARIKTALTRAFPQRVCVAGEISNLSMPASGHVYFSLKDASSTLPAAMWRSEAKRLKFRPTDGLEVVVEGRVDVYDAQGKLQLYVDRMTPRGAGALELAFRQLREKLEREGLFDPAAKKPIARFPQALGVVTSATGAAIRDVQRTIRRRWGGLPVYLAPSRVQGEGAAEQIAEAVALLDAAAARLGIDTILVVRGGGSLEDLWAFNEEAVARAIFTARTPIVSGVGHEVDVTICDLVADRRAPTPTGAAELAAPDGEEVRRHVGRLSERLRRIVRDRLLAGRRELEAILRAGMFRDPMGRIRQRAQRIDELSHRLRASLHERLAVSARRLTPLAGRLAKEHPIHALRLARQRVSASAGRLEALSYRHTLRRGFSVTRTETGTLLRSARDVGPGQRLRTELADGTLDSEVIFPPEGATRPGS